MCDGGWNWAALIVSYLESLVVLVLTERRRFTGNIVARVRCAVTERQSPFV